MASTPSSRIVDPPTITPIVASTGTSTAVPGHGMASSNRTHAMRMTASPDHASVARTTAGMRAICVPMTASSAPASSSPMRVGRRKNAHDGARGVIHAASAKPSTPPMTMVVSSNRRYCRGRRVITASSGGQQR